MRTAVSFIGGFLLGVVAIWVYDAAFVDDSLAQLPELDEATEESSDASRIGAATSTIIATVLPESDTQSETLAVRDQSAGGSVAVASVDLVAAGWIVVHEETNGTIGNALGALRKDAGTHQNLTVPLLRDTQAGSRYWVILYTDDGDSLFSLDSDFPTLTGAGAPITSVFTAR